MKGEWCYFSKNFSKNECDNIISLVISNIQPQQPKLGVEGISDSVVRRSEIRFINNNDSKFNFLFDRLWNLAIRANDEFFDFHISRLNFLQFATYDETNNGEYKSHHDVFWLNDDPKYHRKLSCTVQLSDPSTYEGGNFELYNTRQEIDIDNRRSQGTVIFFPSFYMHAVTPVTKGKRYSLVCWFEGPKWR